MVKSPIKIGKKNGGSSCCPLLLQQGWTFEDPTTIGFWYFFIEHLLPG